MSQENETKNDKPKNFIHDLFMYVFAFWLGFTIMVIFLNCC